MGNVSFDDGGSSNISGPVSRPATPGMTGWLIQKGIAPSKATADMILLVFAAGMFALAAYFILRSGQFTSRPVVNDTPPFADAKFNPDGSRVNK